MATVPSNTALSHVRSKWSEIDKQHKPAWPETSRSQAADFLRAVITVTGQSPTAFSTQLQLTLGMNQSTSDTTHKQMARFLSMVDAGTFQNTASRLSILIWLGMRFLQIALRDAADQDVVEIRRLIDLGNSHVQRILQFDQSYPASLGLDEVSRGTQDRSVEDSGVFAIRDLMSSPDFGGEPREVDDGSRCSGLVQFERNQLISILASIPMPPSGNDRTSPEYPPFAPHFPATPMVKIDPREIGGYENAWIKDESHNYTGTHKDRWAWEQILNYKEILSGRLRDDPSRMIFVPSLSMISSGCSAQSLQFLLSQFGLPPLRVLMDWKRYDSKKSSLIQERLNALGAHLFHTDLSLKILTENDVLQKTENCDGMEITSRNAFAASGQQYYDWLVCEILSHNETFPSHVFVPCGTGDLLSGICSTLTSLAATSERIRNNNLPPKDERIMRTVPAGIHVLGAMPRDHADTIMDKLYAPWWPAKEQVQHIIYEGKKSGALGEHTGLYPVSDTVAVKAAKKAHYWNIRTEPSGIAGLGLFMQKGKTFDVCREDKIVIVNTGLMDLSLFARK